MLTEKQIDEIKEHLENAVNPLFFYDNDADGLCSFLILRRYCQKGKGVAVRSYPGLNMQYAKKAKELNADYIFVLDKPILEKEFVEEIERMNLPLIWIDHHEMESMSPKNFKGNKNFHAYNPIRNAPPYKSSEPVTYICYRITQRKEDLWIAMIGCISDHFLPDFKEEFKDKYGELWGNVKEPFDAYFNTEIGKISQAFNFGLKDSTSNIVKFQNCLITCKTPDEVLSEVPSNHTFRKKYQEIRKKYDSLLNKALKQKDEKLIFFSYAGDLSISSEISNEVHFRNPKKIIVIAYKKGAVCNVSLRGKNVRKILEKILPLLENSSGGGHEDAVGARINTSDLDKFKNLLKRELNIVNDLIN